MPKQILFEGKVSVSVVYIDTLASSQRAEMTVSYR